MLVKVRVPNSLYRTIPIFRNQLSCMVDQIYVNHEFHPHIIGKNGIMKNMIQEHTSTIISFPGSFATMTNRAGEVVPSEVIIIEGSSSGVASAKRMILQLAHEVDSMCTKI